jgi:hypothetical protein
MPTVLRWGFIASEPRGLRDCRHFRQGMSLSGTEGHSKKLRCLNES